MDSTPVAPNEENTVYLIYEKLQIIPPVDCLILPDTVIKDTMETDIVIVDTEETNALIRDIMETDYMKKLSIRYIHYRGDSSPMLLSKTKILKNLLGLNGTLLVNKWAKKSLESNLLSIWLIGEEEKIGL